MNGNRISDGAAWLPFYISFMTMICDIIKVKDGGIKMTLENILGITDSADLARAEEQISKKKAAWLFESGRLENTDKQEHQRKSPGDNALSFV